MHNNKIKYGLNRRERIFYIIAALFLNITLITDLLRGINTEWFGFQAEIIETIKVIMYIGIFVYVFVIMVSKPIPKTFLYGVLIFIVLICASMLATPEILIIIPTFVLMFFSRCLPGYYIAYSIKNYEYLFNALRIYIWFGLGYAFIMFTGTRDDVSGLYMTFGYNLLLPTLVALTSGLVYKKWYIIIGCFLGLCIVGFGGRGALVCLLISILLLLCLLSNSIQLHKKIGVSIVTIASICVACINYNYVLIYLKQMFPGSRTLTLLLSNNFWAEAGRFKFYNEGLKLIYEAPLIFRGILSDRILLSTEFGNIDKAFGSYAHNIVLEIVIQYGIILGGILLTGLMILLIKSIIVVYRSKDVYLKIIYSIIISYNIQFIFSGSYVSSPKFWVALGLIVSIINHNKYRYTLDNRSELPN